MDHQDTASESTCGGILHLQATSASMEEWHSELNKEISIDVAFIIQSLLIRFTGTKLSCSFMEMFMCNIFAFLCALTYVELFLYRL